ncbi:unnamed protein product [Schistosoma spindalis]|nr:unnamed protein product [Schistosoma spindale]
MNRLAESDLRYTGPVVCKRKESEHIKLSEGRQPKKPRLVFTDIQRRTLQAIFKETKRPSKEMQSTIAQQLGLQVSTVANFFMNARRRSLDKWQEDTSKLSSTINSPSDSPYSRSDEHGQQPSMIHNLRCSQDGDFSNCTPYLLPSRRQPGCSLSITTPVSTLKTLDNSFISGNPTELERITRNNSLASCNSFTKPSNQLPLNSNLARTVLSNNNDKSDLFKCDNSGNNMIPLEHCTFNALNSTDNPSTIPTVIYASQNSTCEQQQMNAEIFSTNYPLHLTTQIQHSFPHQLQSQQQQSNPPPLHHRHHSQSSSHPMNTQLVPSSSSSSSASSSHHLKFPLDILDQNNSTSKYSTNNRRLHSSEHETIHSNNNNNNNNNNHNLIKSIYPYCNSQANYTFPVSGNLPSHQAHLDLFNTITAASTTTATVTTTTTTMSISNNNLINNNNNNQLLMRDLSNSQQFDHRFLSTMTSGQLTLTEQALELCSSLAAANAISFNNNNDNNNTVHLTSEKSDHFHTNPEIQLSHELNGSVDINNIVFNNNNINTENDVKSTDSLTNDTSNNNNNGHEDDNDNRHCHREQQYDQIDLMSKINLSITECNQLRLLPSNDLSRHLYFSTNEFIDQMKQTNNKIIDENNDLDEVEDRGECVEDIDDNDGEEDEDEEDEEDDEEGISAELCEDEAENSEDDDDDVDTINSYKKQSTRHDLNSNSND